MGADCAVTALVKGLMMVCGLNFLLKEVGGYCRAEALSFPAFCFLVYTYIPSECVKLHSNFPPGCDQSGNLHKTWLPCCLDFPHTRIVSQLSSVIYKILRLGDFVIATEN